MKKGATLLWVMFLSALVFGRSGGPDEYGYIFRDGAEGISFEWIDETNADTLLLSGDDSVKALVLPFPFRFYGGEYETLYVSTNGLIAVSPNGARSYSWEPIPSPSLPNGFMAPLWTDAAINWANGGRVLYKTVGSFPGRKFVIIYFNQSVPYYELTNTFTYEVIVEEREFGDNPILFQYLRVRNPSDSVSSNGRSASVGIESPSGTTGLQYSYDTTAVDSGTVIRFEVLPPLEHDVAVSSIDLPAVLLVNFPFDISVKVRNRGTSIETDIPVILDILDSTGTSLYHREQTLSLAPYDSANVEFNMIRISSPGSVSIFAETRLPVDMRRSNDSLRVSATLFRHMSRGGPDAGGYAWCDSYDPEGPSYTPISIDGATKVLVGDDERIPVQLPFQFRFYGSNYDTIYISTNGFISFQPITSSFFWNDTLLPATNEPNAIIAPFWDDMDLDTISNPASGVYIKSVPEDSSFHIVWYHAFLPYSSTTDNVTFELVLAHNGSIRFNYESTETPNYPDYTMGRSATVGIENASGTAGLAYECNGNPGGNLLFPRFSIIFYRASGLDTLPPVISHIPLRGVYPSGSRITIHASIIDASSIATDSLYWTTTGSYSAVSHDSVRGDMYYYSLPMMSVGTVIRYYFVATDNSPLRNRAVFPEGDPFTLRILDPHFGGPDSAGYRFVDSYSDSAIAPFFNWVELDPALGGSGRLLDLTGDDEISEPVYIGGSFNFYGTLFDSVKICTNGWLTFLTDETSGTYRMSIPNPARPNGTIVAWGIDLVVTSSSKVFVLADPVRRRFIVEWKDVVNYDLPDSAITFEVILDYSRPGSYITIQYLRISNTIPLGLVGIENLTGSDGLVYYSFGEPAGFGIPADRLAVYFFAPTVNVEDKPQMPDKFAISGAIPNPFNANALFDLQIPVDANIRLEVYNMLGKRVRTLYSGRIGAGYHKIMWDGRDEHGKDCSSGLYLVRFSCPQGNITKKALLLK